MASLESQLQRLILSASDLQYLNPDWDPRMIEDYLNILTDIITLASRADLNTSEINNVKSLHTANRTGLAAIRAAVRKLLKDTEVRSVHVTSSHLTSGNESLSIENTYDIVITLNPTPKDEETVKFTYNGVRPFKATFFGQINGKTNLIVFVPGTGGELFYSESIGEWRIR